MSNIVLGVTGGIAAYKACELIRRLRADDHTVRVVPTRSALEFVGAATFAALSGEQVATDVWHDAAAVPHVALGQQADLVLVAPATADLLARAASGRADDLLTNVLLTARCPVVFAPAMHTEMWQHPATRANVTTLRSRGAVVVDPESGQLTGADSGPGRLPEAAELYAIAASILERPALGGAAADQDLAGLAVVVSAGGTREHLDPVRFIGNRSSGLMGWALARAARLRGAEVTVVAANVGMEPPAAVKLVRVSSTAELSEALLSSASEADVVVMAAAPADFTPAARSDTKIKKTGSEGLRLELVQTGDVLASLVRSRRRSTQTLVGFAAETAANAESLVELGQAKLARKGCDLMVVNDVGGGAVFGESASAVTVLTGTAVDGPHQGTKDVLAHLVWDAVLRLRRST